MVNDARLRALSLVVRLTHAFKTAKLMFQAKSLKEKAAAEAKEAKK